MPPAGAVPQRARFPRYGGHTIAKKAADQRRRIPGQGARPLAPLALPTALLSQRGGGCASPCYPLPLLLSEGCIGRPSGSLCRPPTYGAQPAILVVATGKNSCRWTHIAEFVVVVVRLPVGRRPFAGGLGIVPASRVDAVEVRPQRRQVAAPVRLQPRAELVDLTPGGRNHLRRVEPGLVRRLVEGVAVQLIVGAVLLAEPLVLVDRVRVGLVVRVARLLRQAGCRPAPGLEQGLEGFGLSCPGLYSGIGQLGDALRRIRPLHVRRPPLRSRTLPPERRTYFPTLAEGATPFHPACDSVLTAHRFESLSRRGRMARRTTASAADLTPPPCQCSSR